MVGLRTRVLLSDYVKELVNEDHGGGGDYAGLGGYDAMMSPYGANFGSGQDLYNIFVRPFTDVVSTAAGKTKELSQKGQTVLRTAFETIGTTLLPMCDSEYKEIFAKEKEQIDKIRQEYGDVYQRTWDAFKDNDVLVAAFMYSPAAFLTAEFAQKSPKVAAKLISVLTGGSLDGWLKRVAHKFGWDKQSGANAPAHGEMGTIMDGDIHEDKTAGDDKQMTIGQVLGNKKVQARVADSPKVKQMEQQGRQVVRGSLSNVYKVAQAITSAQTVEQLQQKLGKKIKGVEKLAKVPQQEKQAAERVVMAGLKKSAKEYFVKNLEAQVKRATDAGVPESSPYVQDIQRVIGKVKSL